MAQPEIPAIRALRSMSFIQVLGWRLGISQVF